MSQILNKVLELDPNNSDAVKDALATFFQNLSKHTELECHRWLRTLEIIINRFPKYCMSHRNNIETYLTHFLDSANYYNVIAAAKCCHALQQVRPSQEKTATAKSCWRDQMNVLCNAAHSLISVLFPQAVDIHKQSGRKKDSQATSSPLALALSRITTVTKTQNVNKHTVIATRLRNVFVFLQAMLVEIYPVAKPIRPQNILDVIVRALSVSSGVKHQDSSVITVKTQALRSLDALVSCLGSNLIPFSPLVFRFVMQTLKWSSENPSEESRKVRIAAYSSLSRWLNTLHSHRAPDHKGRSFEDELTSHIIDDVTPPRHVVQLTMSSQSTKNLSKKAKRRLANNMLKDSGIASHMPGEKSKVVISEQTNDEVAIAALECAETFLIVCGMFLKPTTHKRFQERLVRECYNLTSYSPSRALHLLRALDAARKSAPPAQPPPTQYCQHLYSVAINSQHAEISKFCTQALLDIRLHLHCSPPSLNFAIEVQPDAQKNMEDKKKKISERNRAALEALLGSDNVSTENNREEVITIADEPLIKRRRLEDDIADKISRLEEDISDNISRLERDLNDQISVSSESEVEISDDSEETDNIIQEVQVVIEKELGSEEDSESVEETEDNDMQLDEIDGNDLEDEADRNVAASNEKNADNRKVIREIVELIEEKEPDSTQDETANIFDAKTQLPVNTSIDEEEEHPLSTEIAYDFTNTGKEKVTILGKIEVDNVPSTSDTDDIEITCGQVAVNSQDVDLGKKTEESKVNENIPTQNGVEKSAEEMVENGFSDKTVESSVTAKIGSSNQEVSVEDMLADFVDEVNEDTQIGRQSISQKKDARFSHSTKSVTRYTLKETSHTHEYGQLLQRMGAALKHSFYSGESLGW